MAKSRIVLPNPIDYINYIEELIINNVLNQYTLTVSVYATTEVSKMLYNVEGYLITEEE